MTFEAILAAAEEKVQAASDALLAADPLKLEQCSGLLRDAAAALAQLVQRQEGTQAIDAASVQRIQALGTRLALVRDQLARVAALADRQAATVLPPVEPSTYGSPKGSAARIYRAAG